MMPEAFGAHGGAVARSPTSRCLYEGSVPRRGAGRLRRQTEPGRERHCAPRLDSCRLCAGLSQRRSPSPVYKVRRSCRLPGAKRFWCPGAVRDCFLNHLSLFLIRVQGWKHSTPPRKSFAPATGSFVVYRGSQLLQFAAFAPRGCEKVPRVHPSAGSHWGQGLRVFSAGGYLPGLKRHTWNVGCLDF
jgi:hypothetical protein